MPNEAPRIRAARRRVSDAKTALAVAAVAAFAAAALLARSYHPASAATQTHPAASSDTQSSDASFGFQPGSFASPADGSGAPSTGTHAS